MTRWARAVLEGSRGTGPAAVPGSNDAVAEVTSEGLWSRFFGYARSSPLTLFDGAVDAVTRASPAALTTTSFQPIRPGNVSSRYERDSGAAARGSRAVRNTTSSRSVSRPPTPGGNAIAWRIGARSRRLPSTSSSSSSATDMAVAVAYDSGVPIV